MRTVRSVEEFALVNQEELKRFMLFKTGICDDSIIMDTIQEFYVKLMDTRALQTFDKRLGSFNTYIGNLFCWNMPFVRKRHFGLAAQVVVYSTNDEYTDESGMSEFQKRMEKREKRKRNHVRLIARAKAPYGDQEVDVWDVLGKDGQRTPFVVDKHYSASNLDEVEEYEVEDMFRAFEEHIKRTETQKKADRMLLFLRRRREGCLSADIAVMMGVSNNMVKIIKQNVHSKFKRWRKETA